MNKKQRDQSMYHRLIRRMRFDSQIGGLDHRQLHGLEMVDVESLHANFQRHGSHIGVEVEHAVGLRANPLSQIFCVSHRRTQTLASHSFNTFFFLSRI